MTQLSNEKELCKSLLIVLNFLFSGEKLPYLPLRIITGSLVLLPVGNLPINKTFYGKHSILKTLISTVFLFLVKFYLL